MLTWPRLNFYIYLAIYSEETHHDPCRSLKQFSENLGSKNAAAFLYFCEHVHVPMCMHGFTSSS